MTFLKGNQPETESPCGIAFDPKNGLVVIAEHSPSGGFDIYRVPAEEPRSLNITSNDLRTTLLAGNAHTEQTTLPVSPDASDGVILEALAEKTDQDPHAFAFTRAADDRLLVTQADQPSVSEVENMFERWLSAQQPSHAPTRQAPPPPPRIETRSRAIARLWRSGAESSTEAGTVGFLITEGRDYAVALWSQLTGLVYETEESFEPGASVEIRCAHACDMFLRYVSPMSLAKLRLPDIARVVVATTEEYRDPILRTLREAGHTDGFICEAISVNQSELSEDADALDLPTALALGALLDHPDVPACDLALSPRARLEQITLTAEEVERRARRGKTRAAAMAMAAPIVAVLAFFIACWMDHGVEAAQLQNRIDEETNIAAQLGQANADYESSKVNFATFRGLLGNLMALRQRQPATHQLLRDLNARWPQDPTWYISEITAKGGSVEIKGKTRNEQAITAFAKSLEFSDSLFSGILTSNNVLGANSAAQPNAPAPQSSVIEFVVRATYGPLATPGKVSAAAPAPQPSAQPQQPIGVQPNAPSANAGNQGQMAGRNPQMPNIPLPQPPPGVQR